MASKLKPGFKTKLNEPRSSAKRAHALGSSPCFGAAINLGMCKRSPARLCLASYRQGHGQYYSALTCASYLYKAELGSTSNITVELGNKMWSLFPKRGWALVLCCYSFLHATKRKAQNIQRKGQSIVQTLPTTSTVHHLGLPGATHFTVL